MANYTVDTIAFGSNNYKLKDSEARERIISSTNARSYNLLDFETATIAQSSGTMHASIGLSSNGRKQGAYIVLDGKTSTSDSFILWLSTSYLPFGEFYYALTPGYGQPDGSNNSFYMYFYDDEVSARPKKWDGNTTIDSSFDNTPKEVQIAHHRTTARILVRPNVTLKSLIVYPEMWLPSVEQPSIAQRFPDYTSTGCGCSGQSRYERPLLWSSSNLSYSINTSSVVIDCAKGAYRFLDVMLQVSTTSTNRYQMVTIDTSLIGVYPVPGQSFNLGVRTYNSSVYGDIEIYLGSGAPENARIERVYGHKRFPEIIESIPIR